eukprot:scaffold8703_cov103-Cylindrotheca_fusiformis.AAC.3
MSSTSEAQLWTGLGASLSLFLAACGSAVASAEAGTYVLRNQGMKAFVPIVIAGVLAVYGIIISVILVGKIESEDLNGYRNFSAGLSVGLACLASGIGMTKFLKSVNLSATISTKTTDQNEAHHSEAQPLIGGKGILKSIPVNFGQIALVLVFLEAIGLYGLVLALFLIGK